MQTTDLAQKPAPSASPQPAVLRMPLSGVAFLGALPLDAEASLADPGSCKFMLSRSLHAGGPWFFVGRSRNRRDRRCDRPRGGEAAVLPAGGVDVLANIRSTHGNSAHNFSGWPSDSHPRE